jgi:threonine dehydratase
VISETKLRRPTFDDVLQAQKTIAPFLRRTPLLTYPGLDELTGAKVYVKREDCQPTSAFKVRGGVNILANLTDEERSGGVVCASTGNLGQAIAYASKLFGARCIVAVPEDANPAKVAGIRALGAEVIFHGANFDEARLHIEDLAAENGYYYVHSANDWMLVAGTATESLEILEEVPDLDYLFVGLGGGSGAAGALLVVDGLQAKTKVIAVQSAQSPAAYESWRARRLVEAPTRTEAEGLATRTGYILTQQILWDRLEEFILVEDDELRAAVGRLFTRAHLLSEYSGASGLAGILKLSDRVAGKKVAFIISGANITPSQMQRVLAELPAEP